MNIMDVFKNVQECSVVFSRIFGDNEDCTLKLPKLERIFLNRFSFLKIKNVFLLSDKLKSCKIFNGDEFILKNLLLRQKHLKILHLECWELFGQDVFSNTEFSLESLSLNCGRWGDEAESFFLKKQIN